MVKRAIVNRLKKELQRAKDHLEVLEELLNELIEGNYVSPEEAAIAGINPADNSGMEALQRKLAEWDYTTEQSARTAYDNPGIERLQLLRQIKGLLANGMGFSKLFDKLELRRGENDRGLAKATGNTLQPWSGLHSSVRLRTFVIEHQRFLDGHVVDKKWHFNKP